MESSANHHSLETADAVARATHLWVRSLCLNEKQDAGDRLALAGGLVAGLCEHKDDKLIWFKYANGPIGAAITARYGELRDALKDRIGEYDRDGKVMFGSVNYDPRVNKLPPFNKRSGFSGEKEVRFAIRDFQFRQFVAADLSDVFFELFNLRYSEDAPEHHKSALTKMWIGAGGNPDGINEG